jgi:hypothetical protein
MNCSADIAKTFRLFLTAVTLLFVVGLNNREVTTFATAPVKSTEHQVNKAAAEQHGTVKQKISFEATYAGIVLPPATILPALFAVVFTGPLSFSLPAYTPTSLATGIFRRLLTTAISPNAP